MTVKEKMVLIVEDDDDSRQAIVTMVESLGYNTISFPSAKTALAAIPGRKIDLALLDIMMPEMDGYELLEAIKQLPEFSELPVIMVTAKDQDSEIIDGYRYGADYYIPKPFTAKQLDYGIRLFLEGGSQK